MTEPDQTKPDESPAEAAPALIREASDIWVEICGFFGAPHELYRRAFHYPRSHRLATDWIRCLEILVRRIILIMALALDPPRRSAGAGATSAHAAPKKPFRPHRPVFTVLLPVPDPEPDARERENGGVRPPIRTYPTRALARRLDALFQAIRHPEAFARRTASRLAHIATLKREPGRPQIGLRPWWIKPTERTSGQERTYDLIERAQRIAQRGLDAWHARLPELGSAEPRLLEPG